MIIQPIGIINTIGMTQPIGKIYNRDKLTNPIYKIPTIDTPIYKIPIYN